MPIAELAGQDGTVGSYARHLATLVAHAGVALWGSRVASSLMGNMAQIPAHDGSFQVQRCSAKLDKYCQVGGIAMVDFSASACKWAHQGSWICTYLIT